LPGKDKGKKRLVISRGGPLGGRPVLKRKNGENKKAA